jgi:hypothetical protein
VSSNRRSEPLDLERDMPTSAEDVAALSQLRRRLEPGLLTEIDRLSLPSWLPAALTPRHTSEGWEPFTL